MVLLASWHCDRPHLLARVFHSKAERSTTDAFLHLPTSVNCLALFIFSAKALDL
ncbi:hypothetical protein AMTRI_Chr04g251210 [Amborella trichopoda]